MLIEEIEKMISHQKKTIQKATRISKDFKSGYLAALNTLSSSISVENNMEVDGVNSN